MKNVKLLTFIFCVLFMGGLSAQEVVDLDVYIAPRGDTTSLDRYVRSYLGDYKKLPVKKEKLLSLVASWEKSLLFESLTLQQDQMPWRLEITPALVIRDIIIKKEYPLLEKEITKGLTIRSGSFYDEADLENQKKLILQELEKVGYTTNKGQTTSQPTPDSVFTTLEMHVDTFIDQGLVDLTITLNKGSAWRVEDLSFEGNRRYSDFWLGFIFNAWNYRVGHSPRRARYVSEGLRDDIRSTKEYYLNRGFAECIITDSIKLDSLKQDAYLTIKITEGPKYKVVARSVKPLKKSKVREVVDFEKRGNYNDFTLRKSLKVLEQLLRDRGYTRAEVVWSDTIDQKRRTDRRKIWIDITPGDREKVASVTINGNSQISTHTIMKELHTKVEDKIHKDGRGSFVKEVFSSDLLRIENRYYTKGFVNVEVEGNNSLNPSTNEQEVAITIVEGNRCSVAGLAVAGLPFKTSTKMMRRIALSEGSPFNPLKVQQDQEMLKKEIMELGYPKAQVSSSLTYSSDSTTVEVRYNVDTMAQIIVGSMIHRGNFKSKARHLQKLTRVQDGDPLSMQDLYKGISRLRDVTVLRSVSSSIPSLQDPEADTVSIQLEYEELKPFVFTGNVGFDTEKRFNTRLGILNRNFLGLSKKFGFEAWYSALEMGSDLTYVDPYLFYTDIMFTTRLYALIEELLDENRVDTRIFGASLQLNFDIRKNKIILSAMTAYENRKMMQGSEYSSTDPDIDSAGIDRSLIGKARDVITLSPGITFDYRDNFMNPHKGGYSFSEVMGSWGLTIDEDNFVRLKEDLRFYFPLGKKVTMATRLGASVVLGFGDSNMVVTDQLLEIGGISNVRGYEERQLFPTSSGDDAAPTFAYTTLNASLEYRIRILPFMDLVGFSDVGTLSNESDHSNLRLPRFSAGGGLSYVTPIGPIGLIYAHRLYLPSDSYPKADGFGLIHFSIGYTF